MTPFSRAFYTAKLDQKMMDIRIIPEMRERFMQQMIEEGLAGGRSMTEIIAAFEEELGPTLPLKWQGDPR